MEWANAKGQNLTEGEVQRRLRGGIVFLVVGLVLAVLLEQVAASPLTRLMLFVPFYFAGNAFFVAVHRTCGLSAYRGVRTTMEGIEPIADPEERHRCLCLGKRQLFQSFVGSAIVTALFVVIG